MYRSMIRSWLAVLAIACSAASARAEIVFVGDDLGNVGRYDTVSGTTSFLGTVSSFNPSQALGLAYNAATNSVLVLDRNTNRVFTMNATTGASSLLFTASGTFQGGAISNGLLYGTQESGANTPVAAFSLTGTQVVTGSGTPDHTHAMGVNGLTGQLYILGGDNVVRQVTAAGGIGATVVTATGLLEFVDDVDYLNGNFLATQYGNRQVRLVNGVSGVSSVFLTSAQLTAMGVTGGTTGVAVLTVVPEPSSIVLLGMGVVSVAGIVVRRHRRASAA